MLKQQELQILQNIDKHWVAYCKEEGIQENACILGSNFAHQVLKRLNVRHRVVPIGAVVFNKSGWENFGVPSNHLPDEAWSVACTSQSTDRGGYSGHLVVFTDNYFYDPTAIQYSRPQHNILLGGSLIVPLEEMCVHTRDSQQHPMHLLFHTEEFCTFPIGSTLYSYFLEEWNTIYRKSADWNVSARELGIPNIIEEMRKGI